MAKILKYELVQFANKKKYVCAMCNPRLPEIKIGMRVSPNKTFSKEAHIIQHMKDRHQIMSAAETTIAVSKQATNNVKPGGFFSRVQGMISK